jgi:SSS family solute:Na+ symporter
MTQNADQFTMLQGSINVADDAYPWLIRNFAPPVVKGLSFAALAAAIISSLASMFNSTSTLFTMDIYKKYINPKASDKNLVNIGRLTSLVALIIAAIAVKPLLGGLDQAFQYIQEYSGFIYPGIVIVFGLGLLWKRASNKAAVWTAIATIPMGVLFKLTMPQVAFQLRAGYVFMILVSMFIIISLIDKKFVSCELPEQKDRAAMNKWAKILGFSGIFFIVIAAVVTIWGACLPATATPETNFIAYLNDIGFQAFFFFGVIVGCNAVWLWSDANDKKIDPKGTSLDLKLFETSKTYAWGALAIGIIIVILYVALW